ncbi:MAG: hypothetical protein HC903_30225 [Methylacidiphilales bacterium]|nr:hypothetical protein [Candidatus Methylacidiphilales bacterium]
MGGVRYSRKAVVDLIPQRNSGKMVAWHNGKVELVEIDAVIAQSPLLVNTNSYLVSTALALNIYLGTQ